MSPGWYNSCKPRAAITQTRWPTKYTIKEWWIIEFSNFKESYFFNYEANFEKMLSSIFQTIICDSKQKRQILALIKNKTSFIYSFNFRYDISFIDPPFRGFGEILPEVMIFPSGQCPSGNIFTSGNISPNPSRSRSINDKYAPCQYFTYPCVQHSAHAFKL